MKFDIHHHEGIPGVINVRYSMGKMSFDAAIDFDHELHYYDNIEQQCAVPIELYNFSREWDIRMVYPDFSRQEMYEFVAAGITNTPLEEVIFTATQEWIDSEPEDVYPPEDIPEDAEGDDLPDIYPLTQADEAEDADTRDDSLPPSPEDDFFEYLDRYGNDAFVVAIVEMLRSGELSVTWEQARALWERGGKTS